MKKIDLQSIGEVILFILMTLFHVIWFSGFAAWYGSNVTCGLLKATVWQDTSFGLKDCAPEDLHGEAIAVFAATVLVIGLVRALFFPAAYHNFDPGETILPGRLEAAIILLLLDISITAMTLVFMGLGVAIGTAILEALPEIIPISWTAVRLLTYGLMAITGMTCLLVLGLLVRNPTPQDDEN